MLSLNGKEVTIEKLDSLSKTQEIHLLTCDYDDVDFRNYKFEKRHARHCSELCSYLRHDHCQDNHHFTYKNGRLVCEGCGCDVDLIDEFYNFYCEKASTKFDERKARLLNVKY